MVKKIREYFRTMSNNRHERISFMKSLRKKIEQLLMIDFTYFEKEGKRLPFESMNEAVKDFISRHHFGGVALFATNCRNNEQLRELITQLQLHSPSPLWIAIDQEGGIVYRLKEGTKTPGNMALGRLGESHTTGQISELIATELWELGISVNFAPSVDVNSNMNNPIIGVRSFGESTSTVIEHGVAFFKGHQKSSVIACIKHFPGHGNTVTDSHYEMTHSTSSRESLMEIEIPPFQALIEQGAEMVMSAHIVVPSLDDSKIYSEKLSTWVEVPSTFSRKILTELLRKELKFNGVVITDAMNMKAISTYFSPIESTINAIAAGVDMILMPCRLESSDDFIQFEEYLEGVCDKVASDPFLVERVEESLKRVSELKNRQRLKTVTSSEWSEKSYQLRQAWSDQIAFRAVRYEGKHRNIPCQGSKIAIVSSKRLIVECAKNYLERLGYQCDYFLGAWDELKYDFKEYDETLFLTYNLSGKEEKLLNYLKQSAMKNEAVVVCATRNPYDEQFIPKEMAYAECYGVSGFDPTNEMITVFTQNLEAILTKLYNSKGNE